MHNPDHTRQFLELSATLTGFDRVHLLGTGMVDTYLTTMATGAPAGLLDDLLAAFRALPEGPDRAVRLTTEILEDPQLGPAARNLIVLWYCGTWTSLVPGEPTDSRVVSAQSYQQGLQWVTADAHPMGAKQQGYGAWAVAPVGA